MQVTVNGDSLEVNSKLLQDLLVELGYESKKVVIAINETFVPKAQWRDYSVNSKDRIEVLSAMQGG